MTILPQKTLRLVIHGRVQGVFFRASTRERATDFFFEVPVSAFDAALDRLLQFLGSAVDQPGAPDRILQDRAIHLRRRDRLLVYFRGVLWLDGCHDRRHVARLRPLGAQGPVAAA